MAFPGNGATRVEQWTREPIEANTRYTLRIDAQRPRSGTPNFTVSLITMGAGGEPVLLDFTNNTRFRTLIGRWITIELSFDSLNDPELMVGNTLGIILEGENILWDNARIIREEAVGNLLRISSIPPGAPVEVQRPATPGSFVPLVADDFQTPEGYFTFESWEAEVVPN